MILSIFWMFFVFRREDALPVRKRKKKWNRLEKEEKKKKNVTKINSSQWYEKCCCFCFSSFLFETLCIFVAAALTLFSGIYRIPKESMRNKLLEHFMGLSCCFIQSMVYVMHSKVFYIFFSLPFMILHTEKFFFALFPFLWSC